MKSNTTQISRYLLPTGSVAGLMLLAQVIVFACSFDPDLPPPPADALFSGTVTEIARDTNGYELNYRVTFHVIETWKGTNTAAKIVHTGIGGGDCGYPFVLGADYFVYALGAATNLRTSITLPTVLLSNATYLIQGLGEGQKSDQPLLKIAHQQGGSTFSWHTNWTNFRLETSETLQPSSWRTLSNDVHTVGQYYVVTNDVTSSRAFFRLAR